MKLTETHFHGYNTDVHYKKHVAQNYRQYFSDKTDLLIDPISRDKFDELADELSKQPVNSPMLSSGDDIVGFVTDSGRIVKYCRSTGYMVVYVAKPDDASTISFYKANDRSYITKYNNNYDPRPILPEDDYYNR